MRLKCLLRFSVILIHFRFSRSSNNLVKKNNVDAIVSQIVVMRQMEEIYVKRMGRNVFEQQIVNLMGKMPGMEKVTAPQPEKDSPQDTPLVMKRGNDWESDDEDIISD